MYLVKPNNKTRLSDELAQALLLDLISGVIAAYIIMLHRNSIEFQTGGLVVDLYRLVYGLFLNSKENGEATIDSRLVGEVFYNHLEELSISSDELRTSFDRLVTLFADYSGKSGLSTTEFMAVVDPVDPDRSIGVIKWWAEN